MTMKHFSKRLSLLCAVMAMLSGVAHAADDRYDYRLYLAERGDIPWQSLSPDEQDALRDYRGDWNEYSGDRQQRIRDGTQRYLELPPEKRRKVEQNRRKYQELSPQERERLRKEYQRNRK